MAKKIRRLTKDVSGMVVLGAGLGVGSQIIGSMGGNPSGLSKVAAFQRPIGRVVGGTALIGLVHGLARHTVPRRKKRMRGYNPYG